MDKTQMNSLINSMSECLTILEQNKSKTIPSDELQYTIDSLKRSDSTLQQAQREYESIVDSIQNIRSKIDYEIDLLDEVLTKRALDV